MTQEGSEESKESKSTFMPVVIAVGISIFLFGITIFLPVAVAGLVIIVVAVFKLIKDGKEERFAELTEKMHEKWPMEGVSKEKLGMWIFIMSEILLFGGLLTSYAYVRTSSSSWPNPLQIHNIPLGTANTIILLTSSLTMILALYFIRLGNTRALKIALTSTFVLGSVFLSLKLGFEWPQLIRNGFTINTGLPASTYYMLTGIHAMHVAVGLVAVGYLMARAFSSEFTKTKHVAVENVGLYWHFVDIVWMFLFTLFYLV